MNSGRLGVAAPAAETNVAVYTVPADTVATVNVAVVNRGAESATVRVAIATTDNPADSEFIEYDAVIPAAGGVLERTAIVAGAGERVVVYCSAADCSVRVHGFEEAA